MLLDVGKQLDVRNKHEKMKSKIKKNQIFHLVKQKKENQKRPKSPESRNKLQVKAEKQTDSKLVTDKNRSENKRGREK